MYIIYVELAVRNTGISHASYVYMAHAINQLGVAALPTSYIAIHIIHNCGRESSTSCKHCEQAPVMCLRAGLGQKCGLLPPPSPLWMVSLPPRTCICMSFASLTGGHWCRSREYHAPPSVMRYKSMQSHAGLNMHTKPISQRLIYIHTSHFSYNIM